jgi:hypothetical protein
LQAPVILEITARNPGSDPSNSLSLSVQFPNIVVATPTGVPAGQPATITIQARDAYISADGSRQTGVRLDAADIDRSRVTVQLDPVLRDRGQVIVQVPPDLLTAGSHRLQLINPTDADPISSNQVILTATSTGGVQLQGLSPTTAAVGRDDLRLLVTGTGFAAGAAVLIGAQPLSATLLPTGQLLANVPRALLQAPGTLQVAVANPGGPPSNPLGLAVLAPTILRVTPPMVQVGRDAFLTLQAANIYIFTDSTRGTQVRWDGTLLPPHTDPAQNTILVNVPSALVTAGPHSIALVNPTDGDPVVSAAVTVVASGTGSAPVITAVRPDQVPAGQTSSLDVVGSNLPVTTAGYAVLDGAEQPAGGIRVLSVSGDPSNVVLQVQVSPSTPAGAYRLRVQAPSGSATAPLQITAQGVAITAVQPNRIPAGTTSRLIVRGSNLPLNAVSYAMLDGAGRPVLGVDVRLISGTSFVVTLDVTVPGSTPTGAYRLRAQAPAGSATAPLAITAAQSKGPTITSLRPDRVPRGRNAMVKVLGANLPVAPAGYSLRNGAGQLAPGVQVQTAVGDPSDVTLTVTIPASIPTGVYRLRAQTPAGSATAPLQIAALDTALPIPAGQALRAFRYGTRRDAATGRLQVHIGVLTEGTTAGVPFSLLRTFVPGQDAPVIHIQRQGRDRYTDFRFVDFAGDGSPYLACLAEKAQDRPDIESRVQIREPQRGNVVREARLESTKRNPDGTVVTINPDFGEARVVRVGTQEYLVAIPQNSFESLSGTIISTSVYFFPFINGAVRLRVTPVDSTGPGDTVERTMLAFGDLPGGKRAMVISKTLVLTFDPVTGSLKARRQVADPLSVDADQVGRDVPDPPGNRVDSTPQGRRYGQFRLVDVAARGRDQIVLAAHSLPKAMRGELALHSLYTTYPTIPDGSTGYLQPRWGPPEVQGSDIRHYRFFEFATKKADEKDPDLRRLSFLNSALLVGGTPPNGMVDLGDGHISVLVSDAPPGRIPTSPPRLYLLDASSGQDKLQAPYEGAVALDVLTAPDQPARIMAWGGLAAHQSYASGRLQVLRYDPSRKALTRVTRRDGAPFEFEQDHQPVLLNYAALNRVPEEIGVSSEALAQMLATPVIQSSRTFLAFVPSSAGRILHAYSLDSLDRVPTSESDLDLGPGGILLGIVDDLPLTTPEPVLPGSAFVTQEIDPDGGQSIRFKRVTPDGRLVPGTVTNPA